MAGYSISKYKVNPHPNKMAAENVKAPTNVNAVLLVCVHKYQGLSKGSVKRQPCYAIYYKNRKFAWSYKLNDALSMNHQVNQLFHDPHKDEQLVTDARKNAVGGMLL